MSGDNVVVPIEAGRRDCLEMLVAFKVERSGRWELQDSGIPIGDGWLEPGYETPEAAAERFREWLVTSGLQETSGSPTAWCPTCRKHRAVTERTAAGRLLRCGHSVPWKKLPPSRQDARLYLVAHDRDCYRRNDPTFEFCPCIDRLEPLEDREPFWHN